MTPAQSRVKQASASPLLIEGKKGAIAALILAHGSATHQAHPHLTALSEALNRQKIMTLRFNFAYRKAGRAFPGPMTESVSDYLTAADHFGASRFKLPLFFGGIATVAELRPTPPPRFKPLLTHRESASNSREWLLFPCPCTLGASPISSDGRIFRATPCH